MNYFIFLSFLTLFSSFLTSISGDKNRLSTYQHLSQHLENLNDKEIISILKQGDFVHAGIGGSSLKVEIAGKSVFVKQIPLNHLERNPENILSTKNLFNLPTYYQYGVGSEGFSVWREVEAHRMTTEWVLAGETDNFPLMYHWRIIEKCFKKMPIDEEKLAIQIGRWEGSKAIEERVLANYHASAYVVVFVEYIPDTLDHWLKQQWEKGGSFLNNAVEMADRNLNATTAYLNKKGMMHFDAHFKNILTDGKRLYFADFGLATSSQFDLSKEERQFLLDHQNYDQCFVKINLTDWIGLRLFGKDHLQEVLVQYANGETPLVESEKATPFILSIIKKYASTTYKMNEFFQKLINESKLTPYPDLE